MKTLSRILVSQTVTISRGKKKFTGLCQNNGLQALINISENTSFNFWYCGKHCAFIFN